MGETIDEGTVCGKEDREYRIDFLVAIGVSVIAGMMGRMYLDQLLGMGALTVLFMVLFAFLLIYERKRKRYQITARRITERF